QIGRLRFFLGQIADMLRDGACKPVMVLDPDEHPRDFTFMPVHQYASSMLTREYESFHALLDAFYARRDLMERQKQRSSDLLRLLANVSGRITRKLAAQRGELLECDRREHLRIMGDLLTANLHLLQKGDTKAVVANYYDESNAEIEIPLDSRLNPSQNAQRYYALYRKAETAGRMLLKLIAQGEHELEYIDSVFDALTRAETAADLEAIRAELAESGYARSRRQGQKSGGKPGKPKPDTKLSPLKFRSTDGFIIFVGRNNIQNDRLTLRESHSGDMWLHTQKIPGSHTIITAQGREVPKSTLEQACIIAAWHSKARESAKIPVDYTRVKNVKKPGGAKPGMVIYDHYETAIVSPDEALVKSLAVT
ncbi:MAG: NFACT family protein, partial [Oscillospiraceae bacterium]|nr:NFACT family protein [Oscillospiraceae bacterium]